MKKIFITGESGVIPKFMQQNAHLYNIEVVNSEDNKWRTYQAFNCRQPEIDFTSSNLEEAIKHYQPEVIIHSGAFVGTDFCQSKQTETAMSNVYGTKNVVDLCNKYGIKLVYFSTTAIFDIKDYSQFNPITEKTRINPQTYYGITKYAGELTVQNECKTDKLIIRPVFGFSEYPHDLHSALTKVIYSSINDTPLTVLLDKKIDKSYTHAENIGNTVLNLISLDIWNDTFNVGKNYKEAMNWHGMFHILKECYDLTISDKIIWKPEEDYLHYHNIDNSKIRSLFKEKNGLLPDLGKVIESVKNSTIKPYWI